MNRPGYEASNIPLEFFLTQFPPAWSGNGCSGQSMSENEVKCSCNHLTNFGVLAVSTMYTHIMTFS